MGTKFLPVFEGADKVPKEAKIFNETHIEYVNVLLGDILLNDVKGQLLNIIESAGISDRQEQAIKRLITNVLHETKHHVVECLSLMKKD